MAARQTAESFWARVGGDRCNRDECWEWQGSTNSTGYGTVSWHGKLYTAHRVAAWTTGLVGSPAAPKSAKEPAHVLHKCDNRRCCNPNHFFLGTQTDNMVDAYQKRRRVQPGGQQHVNAKLTDAQAALIRKLYAAGHTQMRLAEAYSVSQRSISLIVRGESYK